MFKKKVEATKKVNGSGGHHINHKEEHYYRNVSELYDREKVGYHTYTSGKNIFKSSDEKIIRIFWQKI